MNSGTVRNLDARRKKEKAGLSKHANVYHEVKQECRQTRLFHLLHKCGHLFVHRNNNHQGKNRILMILLAHGNMTQRQLLAHTDIRSASLSELLAKIEANGDIERARSKENARNIDITLTQKGREAAEKMRDEQLALAKASLSPLSDEEQRQLEFLLMKLLLGWQRVPDAKKEQARNIGASHWKA